MHLQQTPRRTARDGRFALPLLRVAVWDAVGAGSAVAGSADGGRAGVSDQSRRPVPQGLDSGRAAAIGGPAADAVDARPARGSAASGELGRGAGADRSRDQGDPGAPRGGRGGAVWRRWADEREGLHVGQVRPRRPEYAAYRLQRSVLHGLGRGGRQSRVRAGSRAAVSARGHRGRGCDPGRRQQPGRDDAADHAVFRRATGARRQADRGRSAADGDGGFGGPVPAAGPGHRRGARQRLAAYRDPRPPDRRGLHRGADRGVRAGATAGRGLVAGPDRADHGRAGAVADRGRARAGQGKERVRAYGARAGAAEPRRGQLAGVHQFGAGVGPSGQAVLGLGHFHGPGQWPGRSRARAEIGPTARLSVAGQCGAPGACRGRLGGRSGQLAAAGSAGDRAAGAVREGNRRAAGVRVQPAGLGTGGGTGAAAA